MAREIYGKIAALRQAASTRGTGVRPSRFLFAGLGILAFLKDLLDLIGIGSLPIIGTVITLGFSFTIFMLLVTFDRSGSRANIRVAQGLAVLFGTTIEAFGFVLNFLPFQTLTVLALYIMAHRAWKKEMQAAYARGTTIRSNQNIAYGA